MDKVIRITCTLLGFAGGYALTVRSMDLILELINREPTTVLNAGIAIAGGLIAALLVFIISPLLINQGKQFTRKFERKLQKIPTQDIVSGAVGLVVGLIIANLLSIALARLPGGAYLAIIANLIFGYLGVTVAVSRRDELAMTFSLSRFSKGGIREERISNKILDTSVIIDGRIADICQAGFIEGTLIIPGFVLEELRHIADSSDVLKRNRGRRGLDILNKMQKDLNIPVQIYEGNIDDNLEVDSKLVKLAQRLNAKIITNDFNLNKVCELHNIPVLNINELANAVKPIVLPGEEMSVQVIKDGKESGQGIAYLDDGTMIVVDGGKKHIGEQIGVLVTSVLQTAAGRMIFAKPKSDSHSA